MDGRQGHLARLRQRAQGPARRPASFLRPRDGPFVLPTPLPRFVGLVNKDGSTKTECGIHVAGAEQTFDRDLWEDGAVKSLGSQDDALALKDGVVVVYAPWCQFCQAMEDDYAKFADEMAKEGITVAKYRGDEDREFVTANFNTESFPTINLVKDGVATKYDSEARDVASLKAFATSA